MSMRRPTLEEPVEVAKFWKNRKGEAIIITLKDYEGRVIFDARTNFTTKDGKFQPTSKGLSIVVARLPELAAGVQKALAQARELGLLEDEE
jgi:hypothetical protein